jgi:MarR family transcriptional regulator, multiple antibiotic resistance protein MarR
MPEHILNTSGDDAIKLFTDLVRCETRLYNALGDRLRAAHGLGAGPFEFLSYIHTHAEARVADLAAEFAIGVGATSKGVDRLEREGLVIRHPNSADRRSSLLALTDQGRQKLTAAESTFVHEITELLMSALTPDEIASMAKSFSTLRSILEERRIGVPIG